MLKTLVISMLALFSTSVFAKDFEDYETLKKIDDSLKDNSSLQEYLQNIKAIDANAETIGNGLEGLEADHIKAYARLDPIVQSKALYLAIAEEIYFYRIALKASNQEDIQPAKFLSEFKSQSLRSKLRFVENVYQRLRFLFSWENKGDASARISQYSKRLKTSSENFTALKKDWGIILDKRGAEIKRSILVYLLVKSEQKATVAQVTAIYPQKRFLFWLSTTPLTRTGHEPIFQIGANNETWQIGTMFNNLVDKINSDAQVATNPWKWIHVLQNEISVIGLDSYTVDERLRFHFVANLIAFF